jgi:hypothetical protein
MDKMSVIKQLAETYPQLYLDPDRASQDQYKTCVTRGERPQICSLSHFKLDERDSLENIGTPAGTANVITIYNRRLLLIANRSRSNNRRIELMNPYIRSKIYGLLFYIRMIHLLIDVCMLSARTVNTMDLHSFF